MGSMTLHVLSLGAGVQSTTMALMAAHGEIEPMPAAAIFSDTGWEPAEVYNHLQWMMSPNVLPFPVHIVSNGNIRDALTTAEPGRYASVPFHLEMTDERGKITKGFGRRQCTSEYKLKPLHWKHRELLSKGRRDRIEEGAVTSWIGISTDEAVRLLTYNVNGERRLPHAKWLANRYPLIEAGMSRWDCLAWMKRNGYPEPVKSSCIGCPFHSAAHWQRMKAHDPVSWADAVEVDRIIRSGGTFKEKSLRGRQFMHPSLKPLDEVDLSTAEDRGQLNMFNNECEGMCGV